MGAERIPFHYVCTLDRAKELVEANQCYGCGLCVRACPESCVTMVPRP
jgi:Pyruvate/2-oxoacid:ferredoxin oxidoreductase delta subunit